MSTFTPFSLFVCSVLALTVNAAEQPNVLIISVDDMGSRQPSCYGGKLVPTPQIDALAQNGVRFTDGYSSAPVCSPSRVGLLTGRYQARSGHDTLTVSNRTISQMDLNEVTLAQRMKALGYVTGMIGKWHVGENPGYLPASRGFDESVGSVGNVSEGKNGSRYYRGDQLIADPVVDFNTLPVYRDETLKFVDTYKDKPWFLYLSVNNVHGPLTASQPYLDRLSSVKSEPVRRYMACIMELDDVVGEIMEKLRTLKLEEKTLVFFVSDNGATSPMGEAGGLRGQKWSTWEGGLRVPFIVQWKGTVPAGQVIKEPVIQLDILPTALIAGGGTVAPDWQIDGVNLLPLMKGEVKKLAPRMLYWRFGPQYAIRQGDWKVVKTAIDMQPMLINLASDEGEKVDATATNPEKMRDLQAAWDQWNGTMQPPRWEDKRWDSEYAHKANKKEAAAKKSPKQE